MTSFNREQADSLELYFLWRFLVSHRKKEWEERFGRKYVFVEYDDFAPKTGEWQLNNSVNSFYRAGIISSMYKVNWDDEEMSEDDDEEVSEKEVYFIAPEKPKDLPQNVKFYEDNPSLNTDLCYIELDQKKAEAYISEYLEKWENNDLYFPWSNILRREEQVKKVARNIFEITKRHSHKNFLLPEPFNFIEPYDTDFVATILFLESAGDVSISGSRGVPYGIPSSREMIKKGVPHFVFRISLTEKFFEDFTYNEKTGKVSFDFRELTSPTKKQKIFFDPPFRLWTKKAEYRINKGKFPYELLNASFDDMAIKSVSKGFLLEKTGINEKEFSKAVDNFRRMLREKFFFPKNELFCSVQDEEITLDSKIFKKREKKEKREEK